MQIIAATKLATADYGRLNTWIVDISLALSIGALCQTSANFFPMRAMPLRLTALVLLFVSATVGVAITILARNGTTSSWAWIASMFPATLLAGWLTGQLQLRLKFAQIGCAGLVGAVAKVGMAALVPIGMEPLVWFFLAFSLSMVFSTLVLVIFCLVVEENAHLTPTSLVGAQARLGCAFVLTIASSLLPQIDIMCLRLVQSAEVLGEFARATLFAKGVWFVITLGLQITLPLRLRARANDPHLIVWLDGGVLALAIASAVAGALVGPDIMRLFLNFDLDENRLWILLAGLMAVIMFVALRAIQQYCADLDWVWAMLVLTTVAALIPLCYLLQPQTVEGYLLGALSYSFILVVGQQIAIYFQRGRRRPT